MNQKQLEHYNTSSDEERASHELATLYISDIESDYVGQYAIITASIRHYLKGVSSEFIIATLQQLIDETEENTR